MKKIAMYGPGHGHNIEKWLSFFNNREDVQLTFIYYGEASTFEAKYRNIYFIRIKSILSVCFSLRKENFNLLIIQGAYSIYQSLFLSFLIKNEKFLLVPWGNGILNCFTKNIFRKKLATTALFKFADQIAAPDQLMRDIVTYYPEGELKKYNLLWGIAIEYHYDVQVPLQRFTSEFLNNLDDNYVIFWPRSILRLSRYDIGIDALSILKTKRPDIIERIKFIIWTGNTIDHNYLEELEYKIKDLGLVKVVDIVIHPFLPDTDIKKVWQRADLSINLIENDGFSTQLGESFITGTPLIVNDIEAYSLVKKRFNLPLKFTALDANSVANEIEAAYENKSAESTNLHYLKVFSETELNNDDNFYKLLRDYID
jgi:glycosyltransferase involved in cell wall biosynthesis